MLKAAANIHRRKFLTMLQEGVLITLQLPAPRVSAANAADKVLGRKVELTGPTVSGRALVSSGYTQLDFEYAKLPSSIAAVGKLNPTMVVIRMDVASMQVPGSSTYAPTYLDQAARVIIGTDVFEVLGTDRSGLPPLEPYILWAGLRRVGAL